MTAPVLHHASIRVTDVARSRVFYEHTLGFAPVGRPDFGFPGVWYGLGEGQLHLIGGAVPTPPPHRIDPSEPHFAVTVDVAAMRSHLTALGIEMLDSGGDQLWVLDPDGNTVELRQEPPAP